MMHDNVLSLEQAVPLEQELRMAALSAAAQINAGTSATLSAVLGEADEMLAWLRNDAPPKKSLDSAQAFEFAADVIDERNYRMGIKDDAPTRASTLRSAAARVVR